MNVHQLMILVVVLKLEQKCLFEPSLTVRSFICVHSDSFGCSIDVLPEEIPSDMQTIDTV